MAIVGDIGKKILSLSDDERQKSTEPAIVPSNSAVNEVPPENNLAQNEDPLSTDLAITLEGVFLPSQNALLTYEPMLAAWEEALFKYFEDLEAFLLALLDAQNKLESTTEVNFLNVEFENLFNIELDPNHGKLVQVSFESSPGEITSTARDLFGDSGLNFSDRIQSEEQNLVFVPQQPQIPTTVSPVVNNPPPGPPPTTPDFTFNAQNNGEVWLNTENPSLLFGNLLDIPGSTFNGTFVSFNVLFQDPSGTSSNTNTLRFELTSEEGNVMTVYRRSDGLGHVRFDWEYELINPIITPYEQGNPQTQYKEYILINGQAYYPEKFFYSFSNPSGSSTGSFTILIADDKPVASDQIGLSTLDEADIAVVGSNQLSEPNMLAGSLIEPSTDPLLAGLSDNRFGPDGGIVSNVTLVDTPLDDPNGARDVTGVTTFDHTFSDEEVDFLESQNFFGSDTKQEVIWVTLTDADGGINYYKVNTVTGHYIYILNDAFLHDIFDTTSTQTFQYTFVDNEYLINPLDPLNPPVSANVTFTFQDDAPIIEVSNDSTPVLNVDETTFGSDSASFAGQFDSIEGADGATIVYSLSLNGPDPLTNLTDTISNETIYLTFDGNDVVGLTLTNDFEVFRITLDSVTGEIELTQSRSVVHGDTSDPNDVATLTNDLIILTAVITDTDGSSDFDSKEIGGAFTFTDDGPTISLAGNTPLILETDDTNTINGNDIDSASFAFLFNHAFGNDGFKDADDNDGEDADALRYALNISSEGVDSGLDDTLTNQDVLLFKVSDGLIEGRTSISGDVVFSIGVNTNTGFVTLTQMRAVEHNDPSDPIETGTSAAGITLVPANIVSLMATVEDGDGDTQSVSRNIGASFTFADDGPDIIPSGATEPAVVEDETDLNTTSSDNFSGVFNNIFGADGFKDTNNDDSEDADAVTYALGVSIQGADSGVNDTATGNDVFVFLEGGIVIGREGMDALDAAATGDEVFRISVNANSGLVTLEQSRAVEHPDPSDDNEVVFLTDSAVNITGTIEDGDGDTKTSAKVNIGNNFGFADDAPIIDPSGAMEPTLEVDESDLTTNASADFSVLFTPDFGNDGPKDDDDNGQDADTIQYTLDVSAQGVYSGVEDTQTGNSVFLFLEGGGLIRGREGINSGDAVTGDIIFVISVAANTGVVTLDQIRAVEHPDISDPNDTIGLASDELVTLTATIEDGDGDTEPETVNIGDAFNFADDGPTITVTPGDPEDIEEIEVDETNLGVSDSADYADNFDSIADAGADNTLSVSLAHELSITGGDDTDSGLIDTVSQEAVHLFLMNDGSIEGRTSTGDDIVFIITVGGFSGGFVTLEQYRAVVHPDDQDPDDTVTLSAANLIQLTQTQVITDRDGDTDSDSATIDIGQSFVFRDDDPSIFNSKGNIPTVSVDETDLATNATGEFSGLFNTDFGADEAGSITYNLIIDNVDSGIDDTATGNRVFLFLVSGAIVGREGTDSTIAASGAEVFRISVDADGIITLDQSRGIVHINGGDPDEVKNLGSDIISLSATIVDGDEDTSTSTPTIDIGNSFSFGDDGPEVTVDPGDLQDIEVDESDITDLNPDTSATVNYADSFVFFTDAGADGLDTETATFEFSITGGNDTFSGLVDTESQENIQLFVTGVENEVIQARTADTDEIVFTLEVNATGQVTLRQFRAIEHPDNTDPDETVTLAAANLVRLTMSVEAIDGDGDSHSDSATLDIGTSLIFRDSGPTIETSNAVVPTLTVDESDLSTNASASFAGLFTSDFGADGGTIAYEFFLVGGNGIPTGLNDTETGDPISLFKTAPGVIEGRINANNTVIFTIAIDAAGIVTFDQIRAVEHDDTTDPDDIAVFDDSIDPEDFITLQATVTDGDGDTAVATVQNIAAAFEIFDDGPSITPPAINEFTLDEANLPAGTNPLPGALEASAIFASTFGADGGEVVVEFNNVIYSDDNDDGIDNNDIITIIDAAGNTFEYLMLTNEARYTLSNPYSNSGTTILSYLIMPTDGDGDSVSAEFIVNVEDDEPQVPNAINGSTTSEDEIPDVAFGGLNEGFDYEFGADGGELDFTFNQFTNTNATLASENDAYTLTAADAMIFGNSGLEGNAGYYFEDSLGNVFVYDFVQNDYYFQLNAPYPDIAPGDVTIEFTLEATDGDGDSDSNTFTLTVEDSAIDPVILDLNGDDQIDLLSPSESDITMDDLLHNGSEANVGWVGPLDGILMFDPTYSGEFTDIKQISFTSYLEGAQTDLEGLVAFDSNNNGLLDMNDQSYSQFGVWQDKNTNAQTEQGEFNTLDQLGITSINLSSDHMQQINDGNIIYGTGEYYTADGQAHVLGDVGLSIIYEDVLEEDQSSSNVTSNTAEPAQGTTPPPPADTQIEVPVQQELQ